MSDAILKTCVQKDNPENKQIIAHLNAQLKNELTAINQYFLHARLYDHWGYTALGKKEYEESIGEMKHADLLINRILMLDGCPNLQSLGNIKIGENVCEILEADLSLEVASQATCKEAIKACEATSDFVSRDIFLKILTDTEAHIDWLETQIRLSKEIGLANYLQSAISY